jgi:hypothetical protein
MISTHDTKTWRNAQQHNTDATLYSPLNTMPLTNAERSTRYREKKKMLALQSNAPSSKSIVDIESDSDIESDGEIDDTELMKKYGEVDDDDTEVSNTISREDPQPKPRDDPRLLHPAGPDDGVFKAFSLLLDFNTQLCEHINRNNLGEKIDVESIITATNEFNKKPSVIGLIELNNMITQLILLQQMRS